MTRACCTAPNEGVALSQTLPGTATCAACTCAPVAASGPPALGSGRAQGRRPPPTGSVCMLKEHARGPSAAVRDLPPMGRSHSRRRVTPLVGLCSRRIVRCQKPFGAQARARDCRRNCLKPTMTTPHRSSEDDNSTSTDEHVQAGQRPRTAAATPAAASVQVQSFVLLWLLLLLLLLLVVSVCAQP